MARRDVDGCDGLTNSRGDRRTNCELTVEISYRLKREEMAAATSTDVATSGSSAAPTARAVSPKTRLSNGSQCVTW